MKKLLIPAICIAFIFCSFGKKSTPAPTVPVKGIYATIDGKQRTFNNNDSILFAHNSFYQLAVTGYIAPGDTTFVFGFGITSTTPITTGTYNLTGSPTVIYLYYQASSGSSYYNSFATNSSTIYPASITITSVTHNNIQGTFSGTFVNVGDGRGNPNNLSVITNGKFDLDYK
jgi:hypothetical protein